MHIKTSHSPSGFTLVEAIITGVVVAVVAMAAAVMYSGFVNETRRQTVDNLAETAAAAANAYVRRTGSDVGLDSSKLQLYIPDPVKYKVTVSRSDSTVTVKDAHGNEATKNYY